MAASQALGSDVYVSLEASNKCSYCLFRPLSKKSQREGGRTEGRKILGEITKVLEATLRPTPPSTRSNKEMQSS